MLNIKRVFSFVAVLALGVMLSAQGVNDNKSALLSSKTSEVLSPLDRLVTVDLEQADVVTALQRICNKVGLYFSIDSNLTGKVTLQVEKKPFSVALEAVVAQINAKWEAQSKPGEPERIISISIVPYNGLRGKLVEGNPDTVFVRNLPVVVASKPVEVTSPQPEDNAQADQANLAPEYDPYFDYNPYGFNPTYGYQGAFGRSRSVRFLIPQVTYWPSFNNNPYGYWP